MAVKAKTGFARIPLIYAVHRSDIAFKNLEMRMPSFGGT